MQKKTVYLAGKITGDPFYRSKFYEAQKKLEKGGFIVVNPALLPSEGFAWEAYMRMTGAMLNECAEVCFLPDWKESKGAKYEFGEAIAQNKPFFFFDHWTPEQGGHRWKQTRNARKPERETPTVAKRVYTESKPPRPPKGYILVETKSTKYGYLYFKYVLEPPKRKRKRAAKDGKS